MVPKSYKLFSDAYIDFQSLNLNSTTFKSLKKYLLNFSYMAEILFDAEIIVRLSPENRTNRVPALMRLKF